MITCEQYMTRAEYMAKNRLADDTFNLHHEYYSQYVTEALLGRLRRTLDIPALAADYKKGDKHLNERYSCTKFWDYIPHYASRDLLEKLGEWDTISTQVCIVKAGARILIERHLNEAL